MPTLFTDRPLREKLVGMPRKPLDPHLLEELKMAENAFEKGRLSRREFNKLLGLVAVSAGFSLAEMSPAHAWIATRMRKRSVLNPGASSSLSSLRLRASGGSYLSKTLSASAAGQKTFTLSCWFKRGILSASGSTYPFLFSAGTSGTDFFAVRLDDNVLAVEQYVSGYQFRLITSRVFRDMSAWMHLVVSIGTDNSVASERVRIFINGERVTDFSTANYPSVSLAMRWNANIGHEIGRLNLGSAYCFDGYLAEIYAIDGQSLSAASFGEFNSTTGQWVPKQYSGAFGANGFYLPFRSNSAVNGSGAASGSYPNVTGVSGMGADHSGNDNHWTGSGLATTDWGVDSPTNNYCTWNPLSNESPGATSNGLLYHSTGVAGGSGSSYGTMALPASGRWYYEVKIETISGVGPCYLGLHNLSSSAIYTNNGNYNGSGYGSSYTSGDIIGVAFDADSGKLFFSKNGTFQNSGDPAGGTGQAATLSAASWFPYIGDGSSTNTVAVTANFGQGGQAGLSHYSSAAGWFAYAPPTGFKALCTANLPTPAIQRPSAYFQALTYTGNGTSQRVGGHVSRASSYVVERSIRFNNPDTPYFEKTFSSAGNQKTWTWSGWLKRSRLGITNMGVFGAATGPSNYTEIMIDSSDRLYFDDYLGGVRCRRISNAVFKSTSQWFHLVVAVDTTQATASDRIKIYVDGVQMTSFSSATDYSQNADTYCSGANVHRLGAQGAHSNYNFDGLMAEVYFIDGQQLTPTSFAETDSSSGAWIPKSFSGSFGGNGCHLNFSDNSNNTAATIGKDLSGNAHHWTPTNISVTAGTGNDSLTDSPSQGGTDSGGTGDNSSANYCVFDFNLKSSATTLSDGGMTATSNSGDIYGAVGTLFASTGKWYAEYTVVASGGSNYPWLGWVKTGSQTGNFTPSIYFDRGGSIYSTHSASNYNTGVSSATTNDIIMVAFDIDSKKMWFGKNGSWFVGDPTAGTSPSVSGTAALPPGSYSLAGATYSARTFALNAGQRPFAHAPPSGFKPLNTKNLAAAEAACGKSLSGPPDLVWIKGRSGATDHAIYDTTRGSGLDLVSNSTAAETSQTTGLNSFQAGGFSVGSLAKLNSAGATYAAWVWRKGVTPGFDVVAYSSGASGDKSINHSLGVSPKFIITKARDDGTYNWTVYVAGITSNASALRLSHSGGLISNGPNWWGAGHSSTTFGVSSGNGVQANSNCIAYLWAEIPGFSKFGSYTGNGSADGPFVWCGFRPAYIIIKNSGGTGGSWNTLDGGRSPGNVVDDNLFSNLSNQEVVNDAAYSVDFLANGFKVRTTNTGFNESGSTLVFIAFAETPFKTALAR